MPSEPGGLVFRLILSNAEADISIFTFAMKFHASDNCRMGGEKPAAKYSDSKFLPSAEDASAPAFTNRLG